MSDTRYPSLYGQLVRRAREALFMSQGELAEKLGASQPYVSQVERGFRRAFAECDDVRVARALKVPVEDVRSARRASEPIDPTIYPVEVQERLWRVIEGVPE